ncbi:MAG: diphthamide biosynthesis enzyme Dph2 [Candidatus ainarchaeum sp.]|nr:diphthamide biosynthesis enzyme Dph2 [Candidatus ainarchaeum sp.]
MKILLQFPEGLKKHALKHAHKLEADGHEVFLSASPSYGACDLALGEAEALGADEIVHFGHAKFPIAQPVKIPIEYIEWKVDVKVEDLAATLQELKGYGKIALATTVQHTHEIPRIKEFFKSNGIEVLTKKGILPAHEGQILGCDSTAIKIPEAKAVLYVGDGMFHPLAIEENKPVYIFNPYTKEFRCVNEDIERLRKKRRGALAAAISAKTFGVLVSTKPGQFRMQVAKWAKKELEKLGKEAQIIVSNELNPYSIANFSVFEAYVNTACPRIADDLDLFGKPILNPDMLEEMTKTIAEAGKH